MKKKKIIRIILVILLVLVGILLALFLFGTVAQAAGLIDDTINVQNLYSQYSIQNYQLDFYVDNSWAWLPWNWKSGIGKSVMYGLYIITNAIWMLGCNISSFTGSVIQEAYNLDFIGDMSNAIGTNIQILAGVSPAGFSADGFYLKTVKLIILIVGGYAAYTGMVKRETSKAIHAILNLVVIFVASAGLIAYAPGYIDMINGFSTDLSTGALDVGSKLVVPASGTEETDNEAETNSVDQLRNNLFAIQIKQPWLLLQYGTTDVNAIGTDRVNSLLSVNPGTNNGEDREDAVKTDIEDNNNTNLSTGGVGNRFFMVLFIFFFNIGISFFVFMLTGLMLLSQILFIVFAMFLPVSFLISMLPGQEGKWKQGVIKLFNTIMTRVGITLIITVAFSISSMLYSLSNTYSFAMIAFLQIVVYAGIYYKLGDLMGLFSFSANDAQGLGHRMLMRPNMYMHRKARDIKRLVKQSVGSNSRSGGQRRISAMSQQTSKQEPASLGERVGRTAAKVANVPGSAARKVGHMGKQIKDAPVNAAYAVYKNASDLKNSTKDEWESHKENRTAKMEKYQSRMAQKRATLSKVMGAGRTENEADRKERPDRKDTSYKPFRKPDYNEDLKMYQKNRKAREQMKDTGPKTEPGRKHVKMQSEKEHLEAGIRKKKKTMFSKADYNEDVNAYREGLKNREKQKKADLNRSTEGKLYVTRRTPTLQSFERRNVPQMKKSFKEERKQDVHTNRERRNTT